MIAIKRCACPPAAWRKCADDWYMPKLRHAGREYEPNVTRYAAVVLGKTITTATEADAVIVDVLRPAIRTGAYVSAKDTVRRARTTPATPAAGATLDAVIAQFTPAIIQADQHRHPGTRAREIMILGRLAAFVPPGRRVRLGALPFDTLTDADLVDALKAFKHAHEPIAANTWAKYRTVIGQLFRWATAHGYRATNPIAGRDHDDRKALRRGKPNARTQRIDEADEARLLDGAARIPWHLGGPWLVALIIAAVETGARLSELLALKWGDVHLDTGRIWIRADRTEPGAHKTLAGRDLPIFDRLAAVLRALRTDEADPRFARTAYVFGDAIGARVKAATAWRPWAMGVLLAHGHAATWKGGALTAASRAVLDRIDWHFHDLRHEAGCRWLESKQFDLEEIRQLYGHATIAQTAHYLHAKGGSAFRAVAAYEAYRTAKADAAKTAAATALAAGWSGDKLGANRKRVRPAPGGPRLITGGKS